MKAFILTVIIITLQLICNAQAKLSMGKRFTFIPNDTVSYNTPVQIRTYVKNTSLAPFSGNIFLKAKRDTIGSQGIVLDSITLTAVSLNPNDSIMAILSFTPSSTPTSSVGLPAFKTNGNGNVIVVWPISASAVKGDSLRPILFINGTTGVKEFIEEDILMYPNPSSHVIFIDLPNHQKIKEYKLYDVYGRKVKQLDFIDSIDVSDLDTGLYWLIITTDKKSYKTKIIKR